MFGIMRSTAVVADPQPDSGRRVNNLGGFPNSPHGRFESGWAAQIC